MALPFDTDGFFDRLFAFVQMVTLASLAAIHWMTCSLGTPRFRRILSTYRLGSALLLLLLATLGPQLSSLGAIEPSHAHLQSASPNLGHP